MLGLNDKITLCAINFTNKNGEIINYHLPFPIKEDFELPDDIIQVSIFETHQGICNYGFTAFNIYIGEITTIEGICKFANSGRSYHIIPDKIGKIDAKLCYYIDDKGKYIVFAKINHNDIVVKDLHELKRVLMKISNNFENIKNAINNIRNAYDKVDYRLTDEDNELSKKRIKVCVRERNRKEDKYE